MKYDVIVLGSGPGGYVAAIRAAQLGNKVGVVEKESLGGICLNWGCIPTKALLKSAQVFQNTIHSADYGISVENPKIDFAAVIKRSRDVADSMSKGIEFLFKKNKIDVIRGFGKLIGKKQIQVENNDKSDIYEADHIIIATGARAKELPNIKIDGKKVIGYRQALSLHKQPKSMVIIGSGAIGTEFAYFYNAIGTDVTLLEYMPNILPLEDEEVSKQVGRSLKKSKIKIKTKSMVEKIDTNEEICKVYFKTQKGKKEIEELVESEVVLSAVGVKSNIENIGLEELGIETNNDKIIVDDFYRTNLEGIYAIGDIVKGQSLAHVASAEGIICVENIMGLDVEPIDYQNIPANTYCIPETTSVGYTEKSAIEAGFNVKIGKFPFTASGKATASGNRDGFVKIVLDSTNDDILGASMVGLGVTEMIEEIVVARRIGAKGKDLIKSVHPHPSMSEAVMEAAAAAHGEAIHI